MQRLTVTLLVSFFGVGTMVWWGAGNRSPSPMVKTEEMILKQEPVKQDIEFKNLEGVKGEVENGVPFSSQLYEASDGVILSVTRENWGSPLRANKALRRKLEKAVNIIERAPKFDEKEHQVGERVVAIFTPGSPDKNQASVIWTYGSQFYYIESSSISHILEFEKRFYH